MSQPVIDIRDITFAWKQGPQVLDIPAFRVDAGERVFLRGPSGSGKSTLLGLIAGVLAPQSGSIHVLGEDMSALSPSKRDRLRADHVGVIFIHQKQGVFAVVGLDHIKAFGFKVVGKNLTLGELVLYQQNLGLMHHCALHFYRPAAGSAPLSISALGRSSPGMAPVAR